MVDPAERAEQAEAERDEIAERLNTWRQVGPNCDCVPAVVSSKSCRKCGRRGVITQEHFMKIVKDVDRVAALEKALREIAYHDHDAAGDHARAALAVFRERKPDA